MCIKYAASIVQRTAAVLLPFDKVPGILVYQINHTQSMYVLPLNEPTFQSLNIREPAPSKTVGIVLASISIKSKILHTTAEDLKQGSIHEE